MARQSNIEQQRSTPVDIEVYCYRQTPANGGVSDLQVATELEFADDAQRASFLSAMSASGDYRVLKLMATHSLELNKLELDTAIESIRSQSRHRALKLQEQLHAVAGYGEIIDITDQYRLLQNMFVD